MLSGIDLTLNDSPCLRLHEHDIYIPGSCHGVTLDFPNPPPPPLAHSPPPFPAPKPEVSCQVYRSRAGLSYSSAVPVRGASYTAPWLCLVDRLGHLGASGYVNLKIHHLAWWMRPTVDSSVICSRLTCFLCVFSKSQGQPRSRQQLAPLPGNEDEEPCTLKTSASNPLICSMNGRRLASQGLYPNSSPELQSLKPLFQALFTCTASKCNGDAPRQLGHCWRTRFLCIVEPRRIAATEV